MILLPIQLLNERIHQLANGLQTLHVAVPCIHSQLLLHLGDELYKILAQQEL